MKKGKGETDIKPRRPALTPETRENQVIADAMDLAERQIREGTASSQVITHFLKLGSQKSKLELEKLRRENELLRAKAEAIDSGKDMLRLYEDAIRAMREYNGQGSSDDYDEDY